MVEVVVVSQSSVLVVVGMMVVSQSSVLVVAIVVAEAEAEAVYHGLQSGRVKSPL